MKTSRYPCPKCGGKMSYYAENCRRCYPATAGGRPPIPFLDRMDKYIEAEPNTGCWLWVGRVGPNGYGMTSVNGKNVNAHRAAYESLVGPVPPGLQLDHLCRVRCCVNPKHLEPVTPKVNSERGAGSTPTCKYGHPRVEHSRLRAAKGDRHCWTCALERATRYRRERRFRRLVETGR